ncbi:MAG: ABC transporter ATP-binding protein [Anaerolineae bacterium]|nr:ABC transporter ATP-binding protein [Anaerolineae bacterium]
MNSIVEVRDFRKSYNGLRAVDGISFEVTPGEIFGLLGPNGAGKTTTLECLEGLRKPDSGHLRIAGVDPVQQPRQLRAVIGVQLQASGMPENITVRESMQLFCAYHGVAPRFDLLERMGLQPKANTQYHGLSTGQKRRLALVLAIAHRPPVVLLDEPTAGLDVQSRIELHALMQELKANGTTIILSTHDMAEAEKMADRVAIMLRGKLAAVGTPREITATGAGFTKISVQTVEASLLEIAALPAVTQKSSKEGYEVYYSTDAAATVSAILEHIAYRHDTLIDLRVERPSLEDRFLEITSAAEVVA